MNYCAYVGLYYTRERAYRHNVVQMTHILLLLGHQSFKGVLRRVSLLHAAGKPTPMVLQQLQNYWKVQLETPGGEEGILESLMVLPSCVGMGDDNERVTKGGIAEWHHPPMAQMDSIPSLC